MPVVTRADCEQKAARLVSLQGVLEVQDVRAEEWKPVTPEQSFCPGDRVRTHAQSRATLELNNKTYLSLSQQTTVVFSGVKARAPSWLDLIKGILYIRSRTPSSLDVRTQFVNAAIRGTEFLVSADDTQGQVIVYEGEVESSNGQGSLGLTDGESVTAVSGQAPQSKILLSPRDAVQWALYYPPVIDLQNFQKLSADPEIKQALALYLQGDSLGALVKLDAAQNPDPILKASLLVGVGRVKEAEPILDGLDERNACFGEVLALRSVIALAKGDKANALDLARRATVMQPSSSVTWTALSYAQQANFELDKALEAADQAARRDPDGALARTRQAELLAALGRRGEARAAAATAARISPAMSRAWSVQGFTQLVEMDYAAAADSFQKAIELDSADPMARFGIGLAKIRAGNLEEGTADMELAANLDPDNALIRSYLGKAYYEQKNSKVAAAEFGEAKKLDPNDPTPWFYEAIKKQTENREVEAVQDMRKAIDLNGNRAVYRSKLMLDDDLAARGSALGRIYNQVGFQRLGQLEAFNSLDINPADYTAHRLLSDTYLGVQRHEVARVSSLLQAQMLQPLSITPLQPQQAENNLLTSSGQGPADPSLNEFNPLFARNQVSLLASGVVGTLNTYGNETVLSGIYNQLSGSLGQYHFATSGFRKNNDIDENLYTAFVQGRVTPDFNLQAEYRHRDVEQGFLGLRFAPTPEELAQQNTYRRRETSDIYRFGAHWSPTLSSDWLASFAYEDVSEQVNYAPAPIVELNNALGRQRYSGETQYIFRHDWLDGVIGGAYVDTTSLLDTQTVISIPESAQPLSLIDRNSLGGVQGNGYAYFHAHYPNAMRWTIGMAGESLTLDALKLDTTQINPKFGLTWQIASGTALRLAYFRTLRHQMVGEQTLEPVQIEGFNQFYDDFAGTRSTRYGAALDQRLTGQLLVGAEVSQRDLDVPFYTTNNGLADKAFWRERLYRGYLYWMPWQRVSARLDYSYEDFYTNDSREGGAPPSTRTHLLPMAVSYFDPAGWFATVKTTYVNQQVDVVGAHYGQDSFALVDTGLGYRLPRRLGIIQLDVRNLFDQRFRYQTYGLRTQAVEQAPFFPERTIYGRVTLSF